MKVRVPKISFKNIPRYWNDGDPVSTLWLNVTSAAIPNMESYVIEAMARCEPYVEKKVQQEIQTLTQQEHIHSGMHLRYNRMLQDHGFDVDFVNYPLLIKLVALVGRLPHVMFRSLFKNTRLRNLHMLGRAIAIEHVTCNLALHLFGSLEYSKAQTDMKLMWYWHSAEEVEHRHIGHNILEQMVPSKLKRWMFITPIVVWDTSFQLMLSIMSLVHWLNRDQQLKKLSIWTRLLSFIFKPKGLLLATVIPTLRALKPNFNPKSLDLDFMVEEFDKAFPVQVRKAEAK